MIIDKLLEFSVAQAVTADAASTNVIDLGADRDLGVSDGIYLETLVTTIFDSAGEAATLVIKLQTDSDEAFGSPTDLYASPTITEAALVAGYRPVRIHLPQVTERYLRVYYDNGTEVFTSGNISAWLTTNRQNWRAYDAVTGV